jgi:RloB-like protein
MKNKKEAKPLGSILIVFEDKKSSRFYTDAKIDALKLRQSRQINIYTQKDNTKNKKTNPNGIIKEAIKKLEEVNQELKNQEKLPINQVFCVVDVDNHDADVNNPTKNQVRDCVQICQSNSNTEIEFVPIISNECFEVWYILHFKTLGDSRPIYRKMSGTTHKRAISDDERTDKLLEKYLGTSYAKGNDEIYTALQSVKADEAKAIANAKWLENYHTQNENAIMSPYYFANPSSNMYRLVERLNEIHVQMYPPPSSDITINDVKTEGFLEEYIVELVTLINMHFENESRQHKIALVESILKKPYNNEACIAFPNEIAPYVHQNHEHFKF